VGAKGGVGAGGVGAGGAPSDKSCMAAEMDGAATEVGG